METLRTSEVGKRLKEEWPGVYTTFRVVVTSPATTPVQVELGVYHERAGHHEAPTLEECIEKVKAALAPKPPPPDDTDVVIDTEASSGSD